MTQPERQEKATQPACQRTGFKRAEARAKAQKGSGSAILCDLERYSKTLHFALH